MTTDIGPADVQTRLDELLDLFRRRLLDDRDKRRLIDEAFERAKRAETGAFRQFLHPAVVGVALVLDRLDGYAGPDPEFVSSVREELLDVLQRHGVEPVPVVGEVDLNLHDVVEVLEDAPGPVPGPGLLTVRKAVRRGYRHGDWIFRPALVIAVREAPGSTGE